MCACPGSATQLDTRGKALKKQYATGRRELEHEFGKSMRYRSIRDLADDETGAVIDLKPIWLMSPLSVSDTLPLSSTLFDVVIFDEASQIPTEEAIPALSRAQQVIVVGDEMQLPPTSFFSAAGNGEEDEILVEEDGERIAINLDSDSLLNQAARNLPATLLAWHYRSRHETLISFSNAAFYDGRLVTIPDRLRERPLEQLPRPRSDQDDAGTLAADLLMGSPVSFHWLEDGVYADRSNQAEARYIAQAVREMLNRETGLSLGIVAFSEAQQSTIEAALEALAAEDPEFSTRLEREYVREDDDQFNGLFIKNLENVQGDERDVIILSICYAPGPNGKMLMNFGPINQRGGEKRLNVIFSRARHRMAVVSSIQADAITNVTTTVRQPCAVSCSLRRPVPPVASITRRPSWVRSTRGAQGLCRRAAAGQHPRCAGTDPAPARAPGPAAGRTFAVPLRSCHRGRGRNLRTGHPARQSCAGGRRYDGALRLPSGHPAQFRMEGVGCAGTRLAARSGCGDRAHRTGIGRGRGGGAAGAECGAGRAARRAGGHTERCRYHR
jgi:hypothetical protein